MTARETAGALAEWAAVSGAVLWAWAVWLPEAGRRSARRRARSLWGTGASGERRPPGRWGAPRVRGASWRPGAPGALVAWGTTYGARPELWCLAAGAAVAVLGSSLVPLLFVLGVLPVVRRAVRAAGERRAREQRAGAVITLCGALAGEVRAGHHPGAALMHALQHTEGLAAARSAVLAAARFGGDVPSALRAGARDAGAGAEGLAGLAACWQVAVDSGAGLAAGLERIETALRAEEGQRADLRAQLTGARWTAALLAALPALGLFLGALWGADPLHVLLHTGAGLGCLAVGGVLEGVGLWWALHIVRHGEDAGDAGDARNGRNGRGARGGVGEGGGTGGNGRGGRGGRGRRGGGEG